MAKRFTDTELWDKEWFMNLPVKFKCLVKFVRDKCDLSGVWSPNWVIANAYIGEKVCESDLLKIDGGKQFIKLKTGKIVCIGFLDFQYGQLSEKSPVHRKILKMLEGHQIPYQYPIYRVQEEEEDKEEDKVIEVEEEKEKEKEPKEEFINPFGKNFTAWQGWKDYKYQEHREKYKAVKTEQAAINKLFELARGNPDEAVEIIKESIANRWKGLFELKNKNNAGTKGRKTGIDKDILNAKFAERFGNKGQDTSDEHLKAV